MAIDRPSSAIEISSGLESANRFLEEVQQNDGLVLSGKSHPVSEPVLASDSKSLPGVPVDLSARMGLLQFLVHGNPNPGEHVLASIPGALATATLSAGFRTPPAGFGLLFSERATGKYVGSVKLGAGLGGAFRGGIGAGGLTVIDEYLDQRYSNGSKHSIFQPSLAEAALTGIAAASPTEWRLPAVAAVWVAARAYNYERDLFR